MINRLGMQMPFNTEEPVSRPPKEHHFVYVPQQPTAAYEVDTEPGSSHVWPTQLASHIVMNISSSTSQDLTPTANSLSQWGGQQVVYVPQSQYACAGQQHATSGMTTPMPTSMHSQVPLTHHAVQPINVLPQFTLANGLQTQLIHQSSKMQQYPQTSTQSFQAYQTAPLPVSQVGSTIESGSAQGPMVSCVTATQNSTSFSSASSVAPSSAMGTSDVDSQDLSSKTVSSDRDKKLKCDLCPRTYHRNSDLQVHMRAEHTGELPFNCRHKGCLKAFVKKSRRDRHEKIHTGVKPFQCPECSKAYLRKEDLKVHRRSHTQERPYSCPVCPRTFKTSSHYQVHIRIHGDRVPQPFVCQFCTKGFTSRGGLNLHQTKCRTKHEAKAQAMLTVNPPGPSAAATPSLYYNGNTMAPFMTNAALYQNASADAPPMYMTGVLPTQALLTPSSVGGAAAAMQGHPQLAMWQTLEGPNGTRIYSTIARGMVAPGVPVMNGTQGAGPVMTAASAAQIHQGTTQIMHPGTTPSVMQWWCTQPPQLSRASGDRD